MADEETKLCVNCKRDIATANFVMHEMHCRRHIVLCEHCKEPIPKSELEQHFNDLHAKVPCEKCGTAVSKEEMENHKAELCLKKELKCEYCDLMVVKDKMDAHIDYCGSRTECCPLCQQYIMLKDMLRHENTGCAFPEPKPTPAPQSTNSEDPFNMDELQQLLNGDEFGASSVMPDFTSNLLREMQRSRTSQPTVNSWNRTGGRRNVQSRDVRGTERRPAGKKSDVNVQRARNLSSQPSEDDWKTIPPDVDYDTMLALQLAHDDWQQDEELPLESFGVGDISHDHVDPLTMSDLRTSPGEWSDRGQGLGYTVDAVRNNNRNSDDDDDGEDLSIPCEFCDEVISLNNYLDHVESCQQAKEAQNTRSSFDLQYAHDLNNFSETSSINRATIPVINNLGSLGVEDIQVPVNHTAGPDGDIMLPCEFCEEMFPSEIIIQHQSVCQVNGIVTPRSRTPAFEQPCNAQPVPKSKPSSFKPLSKPSSRRQVNPSLIDYVGQDGGDARESSDYFRTPRTLESTSNKYSPAVNRFNDAMTRPPRRMSRQQSNEEDSELTENGGRRPSNSAQRTRASLNKLLQENTSGEAEGNLRVNKKPKKPLASHDKNRPDARPRKTAVDSRTVMRHLGGDNPRLPTTRTSATSGVPPGRFTALPQGNNNQALGTRDRQRAHVFSPELRLKPDHNPPPKKR